MSKWYDMQGNAIPNDPQEQPTGYLPFIFQADDPRPAVEQANERYEFGGWRKFSGFKLDTERMTLRYPGDPPMHPVATTHLPFTDERVYLYPSAWVLIFRPGADWEVARLD